jgi:hypothetical protein
VPLYKASDHGGQHHQNKLITIQTFQSFRIGVAIEFCALKKNWSVSMGKGNLNGSNEMRYARFLPP